VWRQADRGAPTWGPVLVATPQLEGWRAFSHLQGYGTNTAHRTE
jgi:hypothetical protein